MSKKPKAPKAKEKQEAPKLEEWIRRVVYKRFGLWGVAALALVTVAAYVWTQWESVKTWPGVPSVIEYLGRTPLPKADLHRFSVAVANLEGDTVNHDHKILILRLVREVEGIQVLSFDRVISVKESVPEVQEREGHQRAREYLRESNASILIWGSVLHHGSLSKPDLYLTTPGERIEEPRQYTLEHETEFRLPKIFWHDLSNVLRLVIATQNAQFQAKVGHYVADQLRPFIERVQELLRTSANLPGWDVDALGSTRVILANALTTLGEQSGQNEPLEQAAATYREVLKEHTRDRLPFSWAAVQYNLGNVLFRLGERESGPARLEEAVAAYREALKVYTRDRVPLVWAAIQNNLGNALLRLGERENGTTRLEEAVVAYREALKEYTRDRVPLEWAMSQSSLGNALLRLGERENGTARLEEAVAAYREALEVHTRNRVPLYWATIQNNLGNALLRLGERENGTARLEEAVAAYREALKEYTRDRMPLEWAGTQVNLGNALFRLGERESGSARLEEAVVAYREALKVYTPHRAPLDWAMTQYPLCNSLLRLGERESGTARLEEALAACRAALLVFVAHKLDHQATLTHNNLERVRALLDERQGNSQ